MSKSKSKVPSNTIILNKKAKHDFFIEQRMEAGISLQGWEVKSLRAVKVQLRDSHVIVRHGEAWLLGALITPLPTASTHTNPDPTRSRKLLMHRRELDKLIGFVERKGFTLVPLSLYWKGGKVKVEIGLAKGKKEHDKRAILKDRDWQRDKARLLKNK